MARTRGRVCVEGRELPWIPWTHLGLESLLAAALESFGVVRGSQMTGRELPA